jgi:hypothetical protein
MSYLIAARAGSEVLVGEIELLNAERTACVVSVAANSGTATPLMGMCTYSPCTGFRGRALDEGK